MRGRPPLTMARLLRAAWVVSLVWVLVLAAPLHRHGARAEAGPTGLSAAMILPAPATEAEACVLCLWLSQTPFVAPTLPTADLAHPAAALASTWSPRAPPERLALAPRGRAPPVLLS